jgi:adenylate kinase family enzyme
MSRVQGLSFIDLFKGYLTSPEDFVTTKSSSIKNIIDSIKLTLSETVVLTDQFKSWIDHRSNLFSKGFSIPHDAKLVLMIVGTTGSGKSTFISYMLKDESPQFFLSGIRQQVQSPEGLPKIGHNCDSTTVYPAIYTVYRENGDKIVFIDTAGSLDIGSGEFQSAINTMLMKLFITRISRKINGVVAVIDSMSIFTSRGQSITEATYPFLSSFLSQADWRFLCVALSKVDLISQDQDISDTIMDICNARSDDRGAHLLNRLQSAQVELNYLLNSKMEITSKILRKIGSNDANSERGASTVSFSEHFLKTPAKVLVDKIDLMEGRIFILKENLVKLQTELESLTNNMKNDSLSLNKAKEQFSKLKSPEVQNSNKDENIIKMIEDNQTSIRKQEVRLATNVTSKSKLKSQLDDLELNHRGVKETKYVVVRGTITNKPKLTKGLLTQEFDLSLPMTDKIVDECFLLVDIDGQLAVENISKEIKMNIADHVGSLDIFRKISFLGMRFNSRGYKSHFDCACCVFFTANQLKVKCLSHSDHNLVFIYQYDKSNGELTSSLKHQISEMSKEVVEISNSLNNLRLIEQELSLELKKHMEEESEERKRLILDFGRSSLFAQQVISSLEESLRVQGDLCFLVSSEIETLKNALSALENLKDDVKKKLTEDGFSI